jgi:hypothetical protein
MSTLRLVLATSAIALAAPLARNANGQFDDRVARDLARTAVRSELALKSSQFLLIRLDEVLEGLLTGMVTDPPWPGAVYRLSEEGDEIKAHSVVHYIVSDGDPTFTVAINPFGRVYRIQGFSDSLAQLNELLKEANVKVLSADQAEAVARFYREVNPERRSLAPMSNLLDVKQAAERQCQSVPFDPNETDFQAWWKHARSLYADASFRQTVSADGNGYAVQWVVLSSASAGLCGGAPFRARLPVGPDAQLGDIAFRPLEPLGDRRGGQRR